MIGTCRPFRLSFKTRDDITDPTTFAATLHKMSKGDSWHSMPLSKECTESEKSITPAKDTIEGSIPRLPYDVDLCNWGEEVKPTKMLIQSDTHRFWGSAPQENEIEVPGSSDTRRVIEFAGKFKPVVWSCRTPLPSGRLCPRKGMSK